jgi:hypothetical protein
MYGVFFKFKILFIFLSGKDEVENGFFKVSDAFPGQTYMHRK